MADFNEAELAVRIGIPFEPAAPKKKKQGTQKPKPKQNQNQKQTASLPQKFEWIQHGDASSRPRARAHVTRGYRRQKAEQVQLAKGNLKQHNNSANASKTLSPVQRHAEAAAKAFKFGLVLPRTILSGKIDPFTSCPLELNVGVQELIYHYLFGMTTVSFKVETPRNFQPTIALGFQLALADASAFHVILSAAASNMANLRGRKDSVDAIKHRSTALSIVNKELSQLGANPTDGIITAVAMLSGSELWLGTSQNYNTHTTGLATMLKLRGGLASFRKTNPQLYSSISWIDYSASCGLVCRRRHVSKTPDTYPGRTNPEGVPLDVLGTLPEGYDLYLQITNTFRRLETMVVVLQSDRTLSKQHLKISSVISLIDTQLCASLCIPDAAGDKRENMVRRQYIERSFNILTLIHASMIMNQSSEKLFNRMREVLIGEATELGVTLVDLSRKVLHGQHLDSAAPSASIVEALIDISVALTWTNWCNIDRVLLYFFLNESVCAGPLQDRWRDRIPNISGIPQAVQREFIR